MLLLCGWVSQFSLGFLTILLRTSTIPINSSYLGSVFPMVDLALKIGHLV